MNARKNINWGKLGSWTFTIIVGAALVLAVATYQRWLPATQQFFSSLQPEVETGHGHSHGSQADDGHDHAADDHGHAHENSIELSPVAWKNLGLRTDTIKPRDFTKTVAVSAMIVERPGRSQINIPAPMTGVIARIYALEGEKVKTGQPVFDLRLTHEDVVSSQKQFLESIHELEIAQRELDRLTRIGEGVIPRNKIIEQQYRLERAQATVAAQRQSLFLHGLSEKQIDEITETQTVLQMVTISVPAGLVDPDFPNEETRQLHVHSIDVNRGQHVAAGESLGKLADHSLLYVEGNAFEDDAHQLERAARNGDQLEVRSTSSSAAAQPLMLPALYVADRVDPNTRALKFYLLLHNEMNDGASENRFALWKYRPGERMEVLVPVTGLLKNKIVLPTTAVAIEGPNAYVFEQNGDHFDRIEVQVLYRDRDVVVLENNGQLVGSTVAMTGAYEMHLEIKNQSGAGVDPHAGHSH